MVWQSNSITLNAVCCFWHIAFCTVLKLSNSYTYYLLYKLDQIKLIIKNVIHFFIFWKGGKDLILPKKKCNFLSLSSKYDLVPQEEHSGQNVEILHCIKRYWYLILNLFSYSKTTYSGVAGREDITLYNAALFLGPGLSVWVGCAGVGDSLSIRTAWRVLPAVPKHEWVDHQSMAPCSEVIICIAIIVATQPTHMTLEKTFISESGKSTGNLYLSTNTVASTVTQTLKYYPTSKITSV